MSLRTQRKLNWLKQVGGDEAIEALGAFVEKASEYAEINNIPYKEHGENENMNQDILENVEIPDISAGVEKEDATVEAFEPTLESPVEIEKDEAVAETVEEVETETPVADVTEKQESTDEMRAITFKELDETIDTFVNEVFEPLMAIVKEQRETIEALTNRVAALETTTTVTKEIAEDLEVLPTASVASLIKERLTNKLEGLVVTKESIASKELTEQKPIEGIAENDDNFFNGFVNGL